MPPGAGALSQGQEWQGSGGPWREGCIPRTMQLPALPGTGAAAALRARTAGAWLAAGDAGMDPFSASPCSHCLGAVSTHSVLVPIGLGHISPPVGADAGICLTDFPSAA